MSLDLDGTLECLGDLVRCYSRMRNFTTEHITKALLASRTLREAGYRPEQNGALSLSQAKAAVKVLHYWIGAEIAH